MKARRFYCAECGQSADTISAAEDIAATCDRVGTEDSDLCMQSRIVDTGDDLHRILGEALAAVARR
jgi:hypothetical protein